MQVNNNVTDRYFYVSREPIGNFQKSKVIDRYFYVSNEPIDIFQSVREAVEEMKKEGKTVRNTKKIIDNLKKSGISLLKKDGIKYGLNEEAAKALNRFKMVI